MPPPPTSLGNSLTVKTTSEKMQRTVATGGNGPPLGDPLELLGNNATHKGALVRTVWEHGKKLVKNCDL